MKTNHIDGVIISMVASSAVVCGFPPSTQHAGVKKQRLVVSELE